MYNTITKLLFLFLLFSFMLDFGLGTGLTNIKGLSLKNIAVYSMIIMLAIGSPLRNKRLIQPNSINMPILLFLGYCILSLLITHMFSYLDSSYASYGRLLSDIIAFKSFVDPFILAIIIYSLVDDIKTTKFLLFSLLILYLAFNIITILHSMGIGTFRGMEFNEKYGRTSGAFSEPNQYAAYVSLFIPFCVAAFLHFTSYLRKATMGFLFFSGLYCILLTGSRGGILSTIIGLATLNILNAKRVSLALILKTFSGILAIGVLITATFLFLPETSRMGLQSHIIDRAMEENLEHYYTGRLDSYSSGRIQRWTRGLKLFIYNPIFGGGFGKYVQKAGPGNSHNDYLLYLATTGVIGFYLFTRIFYKLFKSIILYRNICGDNRWYYNGYLAGLISFCTSMFFVNIMSPNYFFFIFSGIILKLGYLDQPNDQKSVLSKGTKNPVNSLKFVT